ADIDQRQAALFTLRGPQRPFPAVGESRHGIAERFDPISQIDGYQGFVLNDQYRRMVGRNLALVMSGKAHRSFSSSLPSGRSRVSMHSSTHATSSSMLNGFGKNSFAPRPSRSLTM